MTPNKEQYNIWELEFIKCGNSRKKLRNYTKKYKTNSDNPFAAKAEELLSKDNSEILCFNNIEIKGLKEFDFTSVLMVCGFIGLIAFGCYISDNWRDWLKPNGSTQQVQIPIVQPISPKPTPNPSPNPSPNPNPTPSPTPDPLPYPQPKPNWEELYRSQYAEMERQAERDYYSLTNLGIRYNNNGTPDGYTCRNDQYVANQLSTFRQLQHRMRDLRFDASKHGVHISQSYLENANVNL